MTLELKVGPTSQDGDARVKAHLQLPSKVFTLTSARGDPDTRNPARLQRKARKTAPKFSQKKKDLSQQVGFMRYGTAFFGGKPNTFLLVGSVFQACVGSLMTWKLEDGFKMVPRFISVITAKK